jgi:hypothetical protein
MAIDRHASYRICIWFVSVTIVEQEASARATVHEDVLASGLTSVDAIRGGQSLRRVITNARWHCVLPWPRPPALSAIRPGVGASRARSPRAPSEGHGVPVTRRSSRSEGVPRTAMPRWPMFSDQQIWQLVAYITSLNKS